jgi:host factor-I protein
MKGNNVNKINIQDQLLYQARKDNCTVKIFLLKGLQLTGKIVAYDMYSILLESNNRLQLIFKHAISTIDLPESIRFNVDSPRKTE